MVTIDDLRTYDLPENLAVVADRYEAAIGTRDRFLWKWFHFLTPYFRLSTVDEGYAEKIRSDKTLLTFYVTLLDDLVDDQNDRVTFQEAAKLPFPHQEVNADRSGLDVDSLEFARDVWHDLDRSLRGAPRYREFSDLFRFDLAQTINAVRYAYIVNNYPYTANSSEAYAYSSHNMALFAFTDIDLMHSLQFDREEFAALRSTVWTAQRMARIGNWVSTWQRELQEGDFTSGVLVFAYETGVISDEELRQLWANPNERLVESVADRIEARGCRQHFLDHWQQFYGEIAATDDLETVDLGRFLDGMETVMTFHQESEGMK